MIDAEIFTINMNDILNTERNEIKISPYNDMRHPSNPCIDSSYPSCNHRLRRDEYLTLYCTTCGEEFK